MSFSTSGMGLAPAVAALIAQDLAGVKCVEPEETSKNAAGELIAAALAAYPESMAVRVDISGHQYTPDASKPAETVLTMKFNIEPLGHFAQ